jgi:hypothetical protein
MVYHIDMSDDKSNKIERNDPCPCCSGNKYKNCCLNLKPPRGGILRHAYDFGTSSADMNRILFQILEIREKIYRGEERIAFDKKHEPVFQNLYEAMFAKIKCETLIHRHRENIRAGKGCSYNIENGVITINEAIDNDLNMAFKDFFIRGQIAIDVTLDLINYIGYKVSFVFKNEKDFEKESKKFLEVNNTPLFRHFVDGMRNNRKNWYELFNNIRNQIEHQGFKVPQIKYGLDENNTITPIYFNYGNQTVAEILDIIWKNLVSMCEEMIIVFLSSKLKSPFRIIELPPEKRDPNMPVRFVLSIDFPTAN